MILSCESRGLSVGCFVCKVHSLINICQPAMVDSETYFAVQITEERGEGGTEGVEKG